MGISTVSRVLGQLATLLLQGRSLTAAVSRVAARSKLSQREVRAVWKAAGVTVEEVRESAHLVMPWMIRRAVFAV
jgi:hypothetical protein